MNKPGHLWRNVALGITVAALIVAAYAAIKLWPQLHTAGNKASIAAGYATQPLTAPFTLQSKTWDAGAATWQYDYTTALDVPDTTAAAQSQLSKGAYQVVAGQPDVVSSTQATLYRDLITEDIAVTVHIKPSNTTVTLAALTGH